MQLDKLRFNKTHLDKTRIFMEKSELMRAIKAKGSWDNRQRTPEWEAAFSAFNADPVNKGNRATIGCGTCWNMVRSWLQK